MPDGVLCSAALDPCFRKDDGQSGPERPNGGFRHFDEGYRHPELVEVAVAVAVTVFSIALLILIIATAQPFELLSYFLLPVPFAALALYIWLSRKVLKALGLWEHRPFKC